MDTNGDGAAGAVSVSGAPSGGVSGAGALVDWAGADDVGSVIDFLSGAGVARVAFQSQAGRVLGSDEPTRHRLAIRGFEAAGVFRRVRPGGREKEIRRA